MLNLIIVSSYLLIIFLNFFTSKRVFKYNNGKILLTTIPINNIDDVEVKEIASRAFFHFKSVTAVAVMFSIVMYFLDDFLLMIMYILAIYLYIVINMILINKSIKEMRKLKKEKNYATFTRKYIDLSLHNEIYKISIGKKMWLIPLIILATGLLGVSFFVKLHIHLSILTFILLISFLAIDIAIKKSPLKIISDNKEKNFYFNKMKIIKIEEKIFIIANVLSVMYVFSVYFTSIDNFNLLAFLSVMIATLLSYLYIAISLQKADEMISQNIEDDKFIQDDDEFYDILGYKNPNDKRILIPDPINSSKLIINRGNKKGKAVFTLFSAFTVFVLFFSIFAILPSDYDIRFSEKSIKISAKFYNDKIEKSKVESVTLLEEFPKQRVIRTNGTGTSYQSYGNFNVQNVGDVRLYLFNKTKKVIEIKIKNQKTIYVNTKTDKETEDLYEKIEKNLLKK